MPCRMARRGKETLLVRIFHELAHIHDSNVITHMLNDPEIMADEKIGQAELRLQGFQQVQNLRLYGNIKDKSSFEDARDDQCYGN